MKHPNHINISIQRAIEVLNRDYDRIQSITEIAEKVGMPYSQLRKLFPRFTGMSLGAYLHRVRVLKSKRLIRIGFKLYRVSKEVGYHDEIALIRHWKHILGITPRKWLLAHPKRHKTVNQKSKP